MDGPTLSREKAARILGISVRSLDRLVSDGHLRSFNVGRRRLLLASEVNRFLRHKAGEQPGSDRPMQNGGEQ